MEPINLQENNFIKRNNRETIVAVIANLSRRRQVQVLIALFFTLISAVLEIILLVLSVPFLRALSNPERLLEVSLIKTIGIKYGILSTDQIILIVTIAFALAILATGISRIINLWFSTYLSASIAIDLSVKAYYSYLTQPYIFHLNNSSPKLISTLTGEIERVVIVINSTLQLITSSAISIGLVLTLFNLNWRVALTTIIIFSLSYLLLALSTKNKLIRNGALVASSNRLSIKVLQEGLGSIRDVIIDGLQKERIKDFHEAIIPLRKRQAQSFFIGSFPRYLIETISIVGLLIITLNLFIQGTLPDEVLTILGTFLIAFQRILPAIQQIYAGWAAIKARLVSVNIILDVIEIEKEDEQLNSSKSNETINNSITLKDISFRFPGAQSNALEKINLDIIKGQSVGIIGTSGSGKSTLLDIIMGLLTPNSGKLIIDKKDLYASLKDKSDLLSWRSCLTHVPQDIFLLNTNILENIALGVNKNAIDMDLIKKVSKIAQIHDFIMTKRDNYFTLIGERGVLLSGGQRQRIGIARALYRNSQVIILDEATSALDSKTEESLMKSLFNSSRNLTTIMVAHRLTSLKNCDLLIKLEKGKIIKTIKGNKDVKDYIRQQTHEYDSNKDKD